MSKATPAWRRDEPDSPCRNICVQHPGAGICVGCHRTATEVAGWTGFTPGERRRILAELPARESLLTAAGSRASRRTGRRRRRGSAPAG